MPVTMPAEGLRRRTGRAGERTVREGRAGIEQRLDALARQQLAASHVARSCVLAPAQGGGGQFFTQGRELRLHCASVGLELG